MSTSTTYYPLEISHKGKSYAWASERYVGNTAMAEGEKKQLKAKYGLPEYYVRRFGCSVVLYQLRP